MVFLMDVDGTKRLIGGGDVVSEVAKGVLMQDRGNTFLLSLLGYIIHFQFNFHRDE